LQYTLPDGRVLEKLAVGTTAALPPGERVLISYDPADPLDVLVHGRAGRVTDLLFMILAVALAAAGQPDAVPAPANGRAHTAELLDGLEVIPRKTMTYRGARFTELDAGAVLARCPQVVLVDELAHTNIPGSKNVKRWQDIEEILDAGITVITNLNIQHLESLNDVVRQITGVTQQETVPDEVVRRADQVELVDMAPEALRRRMAHGNIYPAENVDAALSNYFRVGNLTALRELALLWTAGKVDEQLERYRADHGIEGTWEARERVVVALSGGPEGDTLIRRAARIAARAKGADLLAVHVTRSDGLAGAGPAHLARQRTLVESLGGTYHQVVGEDIPHGLLEFARAVNATQLVLGVSRRARVAQLLSRGVGMTTTALSGPIDVHLVTHEHAQKGRRRAPSGSLTARRRLAGFAVAAAGLPLATAALAGLRGQLSLPSDILTVLLVVVAGAITGGFWPGITAAVAGFLLLNYYFTEPYHTFAISRPDDAVALAVFVAVAVAVSAVVGLAARRSRDTARAAADAELLFNLAGNILRGERALPELLGRLRETFGQESVTLLEHRPGTPITPDRQRDPGCWQLAAAVGGTPCAAPDEGDTDIPVGEDLALVLRGRPLPAASRRIAEAFAAQAVAALRQQRLAEEAERARPIAAADQMRAALLATLGHDLRTPLAAATAAVESLTDPAVSWTPGERAELAETARESLGQLSGLVDNLLDTTRLQAGVLGVHAQPVAAAAIISRVLDSLGDQGRRICVSLPAGMPALLADPALLERVLANLLGNAIRYSPPGQQVLLTASSYDDQAELRVADRGPGIPPADRDRAFQPFQRLSGHDTHPGQGLGLALARGLTEAMNGTLTADDTPGGGLTMILTLPAASPAMAQVRPTMESSAGLRTSRVARASCHRSLMTVTSSEVWPRGRKTRRA
jgi:two-component system sensor histidine kinase KdpD